MTSEVISADNNSVSLGEYNGLQENLNYLAIMGDNGVLSQFSSVFSSPLGCLLTYLGSLFFFLFLLFSTQEIAFS